MPSEKARDAVLRLMGLLERGLRALTPDQSTPFHKQVEAHRGMFSDIAGIIEARRVRNAVAHGEDISDARSKEAQAILKHALTEILAHCPERLQPAMRGATRSAPVRPLRGTRFNALTLTVAAFSQRPETESIS